MLLAGLIYRNDREVARSAIARGDYDAAIASYRRCLSHSPREAALWHRKIGETLAIAGHAREASSELLCAADQLMDAFRPLEAIAVLRSVRVLDSGSRSVRERIARIGRSDETDAPPGPTALASYVECRAPLFSELSPPELEALIDVIESRLCGTAHIVFCAEEAPSALFLVASGEVVLTASRGGNQPMEIARVASGGHFGSIISHADQLCGLSAITSRSTELLVLRRSDLERVADRHPRIRSVTASFEMRELASAATAR
jgi:hypothetical protein